MWLCARNCCVNTKLLIVYGDGMRVQPGLGTTDNGNWLEEEAQRDVSTHGLWQRAHTAVFDVQITDMDAKSYGTCASTRFLE